MKRPNLRNTFQQIRKAKVNNSFLLNFRSELQDYIAKRPIELSASFWQLHKTAVSVCLLIVLFVFSGGSLTYASLGSLPGDKLFPLKLATEKLELSLAKNPQKKNKLNKKFIARRFAEVQKIEKADPSEFALTESIRAINETLKTSETDTNETDEPKISTEPAALSVASSSEIKIGSSSASLLSSSDKSDKQRVDINKASSTQKRQNGKPHKPTSTEEVQTTREDYIKLNNSTSTINSDYNRNKRDLLISRDMLANLLRRRINMHATEQKPEIIKSGNAIKNTDNRSSIDQESKRLKPEIKTSPENKLRQDIRTIE